MADCQNKDSGGSKMDINDLINPLRYKNLKDFDTDGILKLGQNVFPEPSTLDHLAVLDLVTKAYQGVHLPTLGNTIIPFSTQTHTATQTDSKQSVDLIDLTDESSNNVVLEITSISLESDSNDYGLKAGTLAIARGSTAALPVADIAGIDNLTSGISKLIYGNTVFESSNGYITTPRKLTLTSGEKLVLLTKSAPSTTISWQILTRKLMQ